MPLPFRKRAPQARQRAAARVVRELFERHGRMVHAVCRLNLRDRLDAEDATQQTFLSAYRSLLAGREPTDPSAWLATIARNECSRVRKRRVVTVPIDDSEGAAGADVTSAVEQREEVEALAAALSELTPSQRDAVVLREFYGLSYAEVAAALGVSGPAVESLLFKGRRRLQEKLGSLRVASAVVLPDTIRDTLAQMLPGFADGGGAATGAKVVAFPVAAKVAALAVVVTGGGVTVAETAHRDTSRAPARAGVAADSAAQLALPDGDLRPRVAWRAVSPIPSAQDSRAIPRARVGVHEDAAAEHEEEDEAMERGAEDEKENEAGEPEEENGERLEPVAVLRVGGDEATVALEDDSEDDDSEDDDSGDLDADDTADD